MAVPGASNRICHELLRSIVCVIEAGTGAGVAMAFANLHTGDRQIEVIIGVEYSSFLFQCLYSISWLICCSLCYRHC